MIVGIGLDLVEIERIAKWLERQPHAVDRFLTEKEKNLYASKSAQRQAEFAAGRFAAKEAGAKALGTGIGATIGFLDMEVLPDTLGKPEMYISAGVFEKLGLDHSRIRIHSSISHSRTHAMAQVIVESL
ncbi:4'-phosphopantetheinyl transferase [Brevibacillus panacihumi W25]|uniref:Holo-[acyl-carrier-protein] synthase n=1 Tax=Brevibacillus panacihumi W25 TaxID=1408254 RepID=V6MG66_9BACL|nr:holo-ACP synthase [Brevibacillus panacihumi]EST54398.1 4'-phosphopantetheinyl transferase [Brevibacillus panacihumi W25]